MVEFGSQKIHIQHSHLWQSSWKTSKWRDHSAWPRRCRLTKSAWQFSTREQRTRLEYEVYSQPEYAQLPLEQQDLWFLPDVTCGIVWLNPGWTTLQFSVELATGVLWDLVCGNITKSRIGVMWNYARLSLHQVYYLECFTFKRCMQIIFMVPSVCPTKCLCLKISLKPSTH